MKFIVMHKSDEKTERALPPSPELIARVGKMVGDAKQEGRFVDGAGLRPSSTRARLRFAKGERSIQHGPYKGENELIAGFALLKVNSMEEAIEWTSHFAKVVGDVEIEVGPVTEPWDLGLMPKPEDAPLRVLTMHKADAASEAGTPPTPQLMEDMGKLIEKMAKAGVFVSGHGLGPSAKGARIKTSAGKHTVIDGPFAESKELISGFMILEFADKAEAVSWAKHYAEIVGASEVDVREVQ
jgi:hypothetical protein